MKIQLVGGVHTITDNVDVIEARGGVYYLHGKVGQINMNGGVLYDQRPANRVEYRTDPMSDRERKQYQRRISELRRQLSDNQNECLSLREKLSKFSEQKQPDDDVLVTKIYQLESQLKKEREAHQREVETLKANIDGAIEVNAKLRQGLAERDKRSQEIADRHIDILATLMALYPYTPTNDLVLEFGIPAPRISYAASVLNVMKSKEQRAEAVDYLRRQGLQLIERRGGDQSKNKKT